MSGPKETQQSKYTDERVRKWALYQHLPWGKNGRNPERSLHRSQLETSLFDIESLFVCKSDGSHFKNNDPKRKLKLCFSGGTDDPSIELRFPAISDADDMNPLAAYIMIKYSALAMDEVDSRYSSRIVVDFFPEPSFEFASLVPAPAGPTNFSNALYNLHWEKFPISTENGAATYCALSWKARSNVAFGLGLLERVNIEDRQNAVNFCSLAADIQKDPPDEYTITVRLRWSDILEYRYRYLLATPNNIHAFWRHPRHLHGGTLCRNYSPDSRVVRTMEAYRWIITQYASGSDYTFGKDKEDSSTDALAPRHAFSSGAEADFYLKGALTYEQNIQSQLRKCYLDRKWNYVYYRDTSGVDPLYQLEPPSWLFILSGELTVVHEAAPLPGLIKIHWQDNNDRICCIWSDVRILGIEYDTVVGCKIAIYAKEPYPFIPKESGVEHALKIGLQPHFVFSHYAPDQLYLKAISNALYPSGIESNISKQLLSILLGKDNYSPVPQKGINLDFRRLAQDTKWKLDETQEAAFDQLLQQILCIVAGPPGSGKTTLAATFCAACLKANEKVIIFAKSDALVHELYALSVKKSQDLGVSDDTIAEMFEHKKNLKPDPEQLQHCFMDNVSGSFEGQFRGDLALFKKLPDKSPLLNWRTKYRTATAVFTTTDRFEGGWFRPTTLIYDDAEMIHDHHIFAACGFYGETLQRIVLFGNKYGPTSLVSTGERNHFRQQLELSTMARLIETGIQPARLGYQYHMDYHLSEFLREYGNISSIHGDGHTIESLNQLPMLSDPPFARDWQTHNKLIKWVASYVNRPRRRCKVSVFVHVSDGQGLQTKSSSGRINHQNLVAILQIVRSLPRDKIPLVVTFYHRSVAAMHAFFVSQNVEVRVEHIDSENLKAADKQMVIIDFPTKHIWNEACFNAQRVMKALLLARGLRIIVGDTQIGLLSSSLTRPSSHASDKLVIALVKWHNDRDLIKCLHIGRDILQFRHVLCPENYFIEDSQVEALKQTMAAPPIGTWPFEVNKEWSRSVYLPKGGAKGMQRSIHRSHAFDTSPKESKHRDRKPVPFWPKENSDLDSISSAPSGPTCFTEELYDLCWDDLSKSNPQSPQRIVTISWKSKSLVTFNLSQRASLEISELQMANKFCGIARNANEGREQKISVEVKWGPVLEYRYRYLLACPPNLEKYWRTRVLGNTIMGSVPVDLCTRFPRDCEEIYEMETLRNKSIDDLADSAVALRPKHAFMSSAEAEYYLKGTFLYEEHFISKLRKTHLDALVHEDQFLFWKVGRKTLPGGHQWLIVLNKNIMHFHEEGKLPRTGSQATIELKQMKRASTYVWENALVLGIEFGVTIESKIALLVSQPAGHPSIPAMIDGRHRAIFKFSDQPQYCQYILDSMDGVIFSKGRNGNANKGHIENILMGTDGHQRIPQKRIQGWDEPRLQMMKDPMDMGQRAAFDEILKSVFAMVISPAGCGKTMLASASCAACVKGGERVLILTSSDVDTRQLHDLSVITSKKLGIAAAITDSMVLVAMPDIATVLSEVFSMNDVGLGSGKEVPSRLFDEFQVSIGQKDLVNATAVFTTVDSFSNGLLRGFGPTVLICDNAESIQDHMVFAACGAFYSTLERLALFAHEDGIDSLMSTGGRSHLRRQLELTTVCRLIKTGVRPIRLNTQYYSDPDITFFPRSFCYNQLWEPHDRSLFDSTSARDTLIHSIMVEWVAEYLGRKTTHRCAASVFVNVQDGQCLQMKNSTGLLNFQNLITITKIIKSMATSKINENEVLVVTFFSKSVEPIRAFLRSQGLTVRVEHIDSEYLKQGPNTVVIIELPTTHTSARNHGGLLGDVRRNEKALLLPRALRIVVGHEDLGKMTNPQTSGYNSGGQFWQALIKKQRSLRMTKDVEIGEEILEYEKVLCPDRYWLASTGSKVEGTTMFEAMREDRSFKPVDWEKEPVLGKGMQEGGKLPGVDLWAAGSWRPKDNEKADETSSMLPERPAQSSKAKKYDMDKEKMDRIRNSSWREVRGWIFEYTPPAARWLHDGYGPIDFQLEIFRRLKQYFLRALEETDDITTAPLHDLARVDDPTDVSYFIENQVARFLKNARGEEYIPLCDVVEKVEQELKEVVIDVFSAFQVFDQVSGTGIDEELANIYAFDQAQRTAVDEELADRFKEVYERADRIARGEGTDEDTRITSSWDMCRLQ
ncbi:hypothetical protein EG329_001896 [Mollisiaceae sp. DMI_Dod_QoI]|nr:hypothetical protein EG329_001896 [Helotiales sp. DMI_Dod_QoI]